MCKHFYRNHHLIVKQLILSNETINTSRLVFAGRWEYYILMSSFMWLIPVASMLSLMSMLARTALYFKPIYLK